MTENKAPGTLSKSAREIWDQVNSERALYESDYVILRVALEAWDRLQVAKKTIDKEGAHYKTESGFIRAHPALQLEKESRSGFLQAWRMLNLNLEAPAERRGRPTGS